jgi:hypothetical protein
MAEGDNVEIQCEGTTQEDEERIQWFFNNRVCIYFIYILKYLNKDPKCLRNLLIFIFVTYFNS